MANKDVVFKKIKELHHKERVRYPKVLITRISQELQITDEETSRHLEFFSNMKFIKFNGTNKRAIELTDLGLTGSVKVTPLVAPQPPQVERV